MASNAAVLKLVLTLGALQATIQGALGSLPLTLIQVLIIVCAAHAAYMSSAVAGMITLMSDMIPLLLPPASASISTCVTTECGLAFTTVR